MRVLFLPLQLSFFGFRLVLSHWKCSLMTLRGTWTLVVSESNEAGHLEIELNCLVFVCLFCFPHNPKNAISPNDHERMPKRNCCCTSIPQGHPYSSWRCTQTSAVTKSAPVCKDLGLLHIWFVIQRDMLELPGSRETQLVVLWRVDLLIWVDVKCEGDCGLQRWGHWNVHLGDSSGSCWKICKSVRKTLMVALGIKGSGSN